MMIAVVVYLVLSVLLLAANVRSVRAGLTQMELVQEDQTALFSLAFIVSLLGIHLAGCTDPLVAAVATASMVLFGGIVQSRMFSRLAVFLGTTRV